MKYKDHLMKFYRYTTADIISEIVKDMKEKLKKVYT